MLTAIQKDTAQAIVNVFETGSAAGHYGEVTVLPQDTGHLTYGRAQTTLASGNLFLLISSYCRRDDAACASRLRPYLDRLQQRETALDHDVPLHELLREAGEDPVMQVEQDAFFDRVYWQPAIRSAEFIGAASALGTGIVYDSRIHGSWHRLRDRVIERLGALSQVGEKTWFMAYVDTRREWLASHQNSLLHRTVYRMDTFRQLIEQQAWDLPLPLEVRGVRIDETVLTQGPPVRASAADAGERTLSLTRPFMHGDDVRSLQEALVEAGWELAADGIFGPATERAVIRFQSRRGLTVDGIAGPATISALTG